MFVHAFLDIRIMDEAYEFHLHSEGQLEKPQPPPGSVHFFETYDWVMATGIAFGFIFVGVLDIILEWRAGYEVLLFLILLSALWWTIFGKMVTQVVDTVDLGSIYDKAVRSLSSMVFRCLCVITITYAGRLIRFAIAGSSLSPSDTVIVLTVLIVLLAEVYFTLERAGRLALKEKRWP